MLHKKVLDCLSLEEIVLPSLKYVGDRMRISSSNPSASSLKLLEAGALTSTGGDIELVDMWSLKTIGMNELVSIGGRLRLYRIRLLTELLMLKLTTIHSHMDVFECGRYDFSPLREIEMPVLSSIGGHLRIRRNFFLVSLCDFGVHPNNVTNDIQIPVSDDQNRLLFAARPSLAKVLNLTGACGNGLDITVAKAEDLDSALKQIGSNTKLDGVSITWSRIMDTDLMRILGKVTEIGRGLVLQNLVNVTQLSLDNLVTIKGEFAVSFLFIQCSSLMTNCILCR